MSYRHWMLAVAFGLTVSGTALAQDADNKGQAQGNAEAAANISEHTKPDFEVGLPLAITGFIERIATTLESIEAKGDPPEKNRA